MTDHTNPPQPHRCPSCNTETTYAAFSGGREWYCPNCQDNGSYEDGEAPRRVTMFRTPEGAAALRQEMHAHEHLAQASRVRNEPDTSLTRRP